jgi:hypothetical protein
MHDGAGWSGWVHKSYVRLHSSSLILIIPQIQFIPCLNVSHTTGKYEREK